MSKKWVFFWGVLGVFLILSAMPVAWAMPEQQGDNWTVPTRTPTSAPPTDPPPTDPPPTDPPPTDPPATDPPTSEPSATATRTKTAVTSTPTRTPKVSRTPTATPDDLTLTVTPTGTPTGTPDTTATSEAGTGESASSNVGSSGALREGDEDAQTGNLDEQSGPDPSLTPTGDVRATSPVEDRDQTRGAARTTALVIGGGILFLVGLFVLLAGIRRR